MIKELSVDFDIKECCEALRVSRSGYYRWGRAEPSRREKENAELVEQIREVFEANKSRYGSPRVTRELRQRGLKCGRNRIARLMRENELAARAKKAFRPRTTLPGGGASPNLIKGLEPSGVNQVWVSDITYIATLEGWLYLAIILDLFSRKVVGWKLGETLEAELVVTALENALTMRTPDRGLYFHSDRGSQYSSQAVHVGSKEAGPRVAAIISIGETCRRLSLPLRDYLSSVLPGLPDFPSNRVAEFTPKAWATRI